MYVTEGTLSMLIMELVVQAINVGIFVFMMLILLAIAIAAVYALRVGAIS
jgi:hypothetical protein